MTIKEAVPCKAWTFRGRRDIENTGSGVAMCMLTVSPDHAMGDERTKSLRVNEHHRNKSSASVAGCMNFSKACPIDVLPLTELDQRIMNTKVSVPAGKPYGAAMSPWRSHLDGKMQPNEDEVIRGKKRVGFQLESKCVLDDANRRLCDEERKTAVLEKTLDDARTREGERLSQDALKKQLLNRQRSKDIELFNLKTTRDKIESRGSQGSTSTSLFLSTNEDGNGNDVIGKVSAYREALCDQITTRRQKKMQQEAEEKAQDAAQAAKKQISLLNGLRKEMLHDLSRRQQLKNSLDKQLSDRGYTPQSS